MTHNEPIPFYGWLNLGDQPDEQSVDCSKPESSGDQSGPISLTKTVDLLSPIEPPEL